MTGLEPQILAALLSVFASILAGIVPKLLEIFGVSPRTQQTPDQKLTYQEKVTKLSQILLNSASEMDDTLREMINDVNDQKELVEALEKEVNDLAERKEMLDKLTPEVAKHFYAMVEKNQRESEKKAWRQNSLFFALGILVSIPINLLTN